MKSVILRFALTIPLAFSASVSMGVLYTACLMPDSKTVKDVITVVEDVLSVTEIACVLGHEEIGNEGAIADVCKMARTKAPAIRKLLDSPDVQALVAAKRAALAKDAGPKDSGGQ